MVTLDTLRIGKTFSSYDDVLKFIDDLAEEQSYPLKVLDSCTIQTYNKKLSPHNQLDTKWVYKFVHVVCSHYGEHKSRSSGLRPNQKVYAVNCSFNFRVVFQPKMDLFRLEKDKFCREHTNHLCSKDHIKLYRNPTLTRKEMHQSWGHYMKSKDLQNMKQAMTGLSSNTWAATSEILANLGNNPENIVNVSTDDKGDIQCIYVQLADQRRFYQKYGEVLQLDGTHNVTQLSMPLYTLVVQDNFGVGQPVGFFFVREETEALIAMGLKYFCDNNDNSITEVFLTDKDCGEIAALRYHLTIKNVLKRKGKKFNTVLETLLDIATSRLLDRDATTLEAEIRFPVITLPPRLTALRESLTPYGWELVYKQSAKPTTSYQWTMLNEENLHLVTTKSGHFRVKADFRDCSCWFSNNYRLPCSHVLFAVSTVHGTLPSYERWNVGRVNTSIANNPLLPNVEPTVTVAVGPNRQIKSARTTVGDLNLVLASIGTTIQSFPLPVMQGCINLLRTLNDRWKANEPTNLLDDGNVLAFVDQVYVPLTLPETNTAPHQDSSPIAGPSGIRNLSRVAVPAEREITPVAMASCSSEAASQPVTSSVAVAAVISPRSGIKRKLATCHLPEQKTRAGRPKKQRALDHYRFYPKSFPEKTKEEQSTMVITWLAGRTHAEAAVNNNQKITEEMVRSIPESVSTALLEDDVGKVIPSLKVYFDDDAWDAAMSLTKKRGPAKTTAKKTPHVAGQKKGPSKNDGQKNTTCTRPKKVTSENDGQKKGPSKNDGQKNTTCTRPKKVTSENDGQKKGPSKNDGQKKRPSKNEGQKNTTYSRPKKVASKNDGQKKGPSKNDGQKNTTCSRPKNTTCSRPKKTTCSRPKKVASENDGQKKRPSKNEGQKNTTYSRPKKVASKNDGQKNTTCSLQKCSRPKKTTCSRPTKHNM
ncbi:hypothetical protein GHT06_014262 [Daphnia sinensis]|uniref:SWIM-type domain-containing protein n=1 Tax=Daphnia sinensis TaxID=1820382 RepID=A0AAD5PW17_9CRUS|nr:hypothetical protein GHT06_014262 [Daphnia sinensis]